jgi:hypothetical protein
VRHASRTPVQVSASFNESSTYISTPLTSPTSATPSSMHIPHSTYLQASPSGCPLRLDRRPWCASFPLRSPLRAQNDALCPQPTYSHYQHSMNSNYSPSSRCPQQSLPLRARHRYVLCLWNALSVLIFYLFLPTSTGTRLVAPPHPVLMLILFFCFEILDLR